MKQVLLILIKNKLWITLKHVLYGKPLTLLRLALTHNRVGLPHLRFIFYDFVRVISYLLTYLISAQSSTIDVRLTNRTLQAKSVVYCDKDGVNDVPKPV